MKYFTLAYWAVISCISKHIDFSGTNGTNNLAFEITMILMDKFKNVNENVWNVYESNGQVLLATR